MKKKIEKIVEMIAMAPLVLLAFVVICVIVIPLVVVLVALAFARAPLQLVRYLRLRWQVRRMPKGLVLVYSSQGKWAHFVLWRQADLQGVELLDVMTASQAKRAKLLLQLAKLGKRDWMPVFTGQNAIALRFKRGVGLRSLGTMLFEVDTADCVISGRSEYKLQKLMRQYPQRNKL